MVDAISPPRDYFADLVHSDGTVRGVLRVRRAWPRKYNNGYDIEKRGSSFVGKGRTTGCENRSLLQHETGRDSDATPSGLMSSIAHPDAIEAAY